MPWTVVTPENMQGAGKSTLGVQGKRPLIPVVLALMVGLAAGALGVGASGVKLLLIGMVKFLPIILAILCLLAILSLFWGADRTIWTLPLVFSLLGVVVSLVFFFKLGVEFYHQALSPDFPPHHLARLPQGKEVILSGHLARPSRMGTEQTSLFMAVEAWKGPKGWVPATGQLLVTTPLVTPPPVGTRLVVRGNLREPRDHLNPGAPNRARQLAADGIFRQMPVNDLQHLVFLISPEGVTLAERLRGGIRHLLRDMDATPRAFYLAMLLGDQGEVTPAMRHNLARTGTSHLLAINGLHLGAVATVAYFLVFWLLRRFPWLLLRVNAVRVATLAAALPVVAYAHIAGGSPSTQRAEVMVLAFLLLMFLGRPREVWSTLALAALVILVLSPLRLFSASFQLSFAAVAGLLYFLPSLAEEDKAAGRTGDALPSKWAGLWRWLKGALAVSFVASVVTAPLAFYHFQAVSLYGFLVNLVAIPLVLMVVLPLGELAVLAQALSFSTVAFWLLTIGKYPLIWGYEAIVWVARLPGSGLGGSTHTWLQVALMYAILLLIFPLRRFRLSLAGAALVTVVLAVTVIAPLNRSSWLFEITILDSTSGLEGVVVAPGGERLVFSGARPTWPGQKGGRPGPLPAFLHWRLYRHLEVVAALPLNSRNAPGMLALAQQFQMGGFWWKQEGPAGKAMIELMNFLGDAGRPARSLDKGNPPRALGEVSLDYPSWDGGQGLALEVSYQGQRVLLLPPLRQKALLKLPWPSDRPLAALVAPGDVPSEVLERLRPKRLVLYGDLGDEKALPRWPINFTHKGAVSLYLDPGGLTVKEWTP